LLCAAETSTKEGERVAFNQTTIFVQHAGGFGGRRTSDKMVMPADTPTRAPDVSEREKTSTDQVCNGSSHCGLHSFYWHTQSKTRRRCAVGSPWLRTDLGGGSSATSRLQCSTTVNWMSLSIVSSSRKMAAPVVQDQTILATSVESEDAATVPVSDCFPISLNTIDEICHPGGSVGTQVPLLKQGTA